jgi:hypothetical protein
MVPFLQLLNNDGAMTHVLQYFTIEGCKQRLLLPAVCKAFNDACKIPEIKWSMCDSTDLSWRISCRYHIQGLGSWEKCVKKFVVKLIELALLNVVLLKRHNQAEKKQMGILGFQIIVVQQRIPWYAAMEKLALDNTFLSVEAGPFRCNQHRDSSVTFGIYKFMKFLGYDYHLATTHDFLDQASSSELPSTTLTNIAGHTVKFINWRTPVCWPEFRFLETVEAKKQHTIHLNELKYYGTLRSLLKQVGEEAASVAADFAAFSARAAEKRKLLQQGIGVRSSLRLLSAMPARGTKNPLVFWKSRSRGSHSKVPYKPAASVPWTKIHGQWFRSSLKGKDYPGMGARRALPKK